jgi:hypothetical protein
MEQCWNDWMDADRVKPKNLEKNLSRRHFIHTNPTWKAQAQTKASMVRSQHLTT